MAVLPRTGQVAISQANGCMPACLTQQRDQLGDGSSSDDGGDDDDANHHYNGPSL